MNLEKHPDAKALIFDLDGTLSNSIPVHVAIWKKVCKHYHCWLDEDIVVKLTGSPTICFAERIIADNDMTGKIDAKEMVEMKQSIFRDHAHLLKPFPMVVDLVYKYHGVLPMAVGTGAGRKSATVQLAQLNLTDYFDVIVTADDVTNHKPEPETFLKCAELMNVQPSDCQVFEDGVFGIKAAKTAGMFLTDVRPYTNCLKFQV